MRLFAIIVLALLLSACAQTQLAIFTAKKVTGAVDDAAKPTPTYKVGNPYEINGVRYTPREDPDYDVTGIASWYGVPFHGKTTANGEIYDMNDLTAAHKTLPMPTMVRVTNLENGRSIILRVNDRGPFVNGRIIDLSRRAAQLLGFEAQGTAKVRVSVLQTASRRYVAGKPVTTDEERNAVVAVPRIEVSGEALPPPNGVAVAPAPPQSNSPIVSLEPVRKTEVFIQAGAFTVYENAKRLHDELRAIGSTRVSTVTIQGQTFHRVRLGPMTTVEQADIILAKVIDSGYVDARIIID